jgi:hypothetical protein
MATEEIELPEDLIELKVRLLAARAECERIAAEQPGCRSPSGTNQSELRHPATTPLLSCPNPRSARS